MEKTYNLFLSHSWAHSNDYEGLLDALKRDMTFKFRDFSVPKNDPVHTNGTDKQLYDAIENKIRPTSAVLILAGVYSTYSKWINKEIEIAQSYQKPIIGIKPWGNERISTTVSNAADEMVFWHTDSIINAIRSHCNE
jgi:hypothetical protein